MEFPMKLGIGMFVRHEMEPLGAARQPASLQSRVAMPQVRQLVRGTGSEVTASAWNGSRTRWAAGTADGALQIWERCDDGAERGPLSLSASWPLGESVGGDKAAAAHVVWAPQEFGGKLAVACRGSSRVHIWGKVGGAGEGGDGRDRATGKRGGDGGSGSGREERDGEERNREGEPDTEMGGGGGGEKGGGAEADQSGAGGGNRWRQMAVVDVAVTSEGRMVVHRCNDCLTLSHWSLETDVALFPYADVSMGKELLSRAIIAVHPSTRAFGQSPAVAIATCAAAGSNKGESNTAKVWVRSDRYMHWHAIADLLPATSATTAANQPPPPVTSIAWAPTLDRPFDVVAVAASSAVNLVRIDYPNQPGSAQQFTEPDEAQDAMGMGDGSEAGRYHSKPSKAAVQVRQVARLASTSSAQVHQVSWDLLGSSLATVGADGVVTVWKQSAMGKWVGHPVYAAN
ncbi:unnamed protein product [Closterium sp. Yama58-4]|nr:unnamed protein product [Closterium sp. Yama58-4]